MDMDEYEKMDMEDYLSLREQFIDNHRIEQQNRDKTCRNVLDGKTNKNVLDGKTCRNVLEYKNKMVGGGNKLPLKLSDFI